MIPKNTLQLKVVLSLIVISCLGLQSNILCAQTTAIPDQLFEQALIDLGIDSDGIINGLVLTSDIETVVTLDLNFEGIEDLTGIEDFAALEILDAGGNQLTILDVSNNVQLKELYCSSDSAGFNMLMTTLDLSANVNLEVLYGENLIFLESVNVKNGNNSLLTVTLPCEFEGIPCELTELNCVTVDDENAANNNDPPYSNWFIDANYIYSEDCSLGISSQSGNYFSVYPNPVKDVLFFASNTDLDVIGLFIYDVHGRLVKSINSFDDKLINLQELKSGLYFIRLKDSSGQTTIKKFIKN